MIIYLLHALSTQYQILYIQNSTKFLNPWECLRFEEARLKQEKMMIENCGIHIFPLQRYLNVYLISVPLLLSVGNIITLLTKYVTVNFDEMEQYIRKRRQTNSYIRILGHVLYSKSSYTCYIISVANLSLISLLKFSST